MDQSELISFYLNAGVEPVVSYMLGKCSLHVTTVSGVFKFLKIESQVELSIHSIAGGYAVVSAPQVRKKLLFSHRIDLVPS